MVSTDGIKTVPMQHHWWKEIISRTVVYYATHQMSLAWRFLGKRYHHHILNLDSIQVGLSRDLAVQWLRKIDDDTLNNTWLLACNVVTLSITVMLKYVSLCWWKNSYSKRHQINRIFHQWSFHMNFIKLAKGLFEKLHMKWPLV